MKKSIPLMVGVLLVSTLSACASVPPNIEALSAAPSSPSLSSFVGTWQQGEPCTHGFARMVLREGEGVIEGRWATYLNGWGLTTGGLRGSPDGGFLRLEMCSDASIASMSGAPPRYAEVECPELAFWNGSRGIRVDESTGELLWVHPDLSARARMRPVDPSVAVPLQCPPSDSAE